MIKNISISECLISLEGVLNIEYSADISTAKLIDHTIRSLESRYGVTINKSLYDIQNESQLSAETVGKLISNISTALQHLALYNIMCYYQKSIPFNLADVNYLRYAQSEMKSYLACLIDEELYNSEHKNILDAFTVALDNITPTFIKRLFVVLLVLDKLGMYDAASVVATTLYMGVL